MKKPPTVADSVPTSGARKSTQRGQQAATDVRAVKRAVARLHALLRDVDGNTSLLHRFDELTKLLLLKLAGDKAGSDPFIRHHDEGDATYVERVRRAYSAHAHAAGARVPPAFAALVASDDAILQCGAVLASLSFSEATFDIKGLAYEEVIRGTFDKGDHQQFFTPHHVVAFMVRLMTPFLHGTVGDPACGTAGFLAEVLRSGAAHERLVGLEVDDRLGWVAGVNLLLHGGARFDVSVLPDGGTLGAGANVWSGAFDAILTNPPFGSDLTDPDLLATFALGRGRSSRRRGILFLERCFDLLRPGGVMAVIIDDGVLAQASTEDVRAFLLERFEVLAVISLPDTTFMPYAMVSASILVLRKAGAPPVNGRVFYARAEHVGRKPNGDDDVAHDASGGSSLRSDLPSILAAFEGWRDGRCASTGASGALAFEVDYATSVTDASGLRMDVRFQDPARRRSSEILAARDDLVTLAELCVERNETLAPAESSTEPTILYTGLADIEPRTGVARQVRTPAASLQSLVKRYEPGDIVFARLRPNLRKVALMDVAEGGFVSPECVVLTVRRAPDGRPRMDPGLLAALLRSDLVYGQLGHLVSGIGRPRLNVADLRRVRVPAPGSEVQRDVEAELARMQARVRALRAQVDALEAESAELQLRSVEVVAERLLDAGRGR